MKNECCEKNVGQSERGISALIGAGLVVCAFKHKGFRRIIEAGLAASALYRGVSGKCALYKAMDVNTNKEEALPSPA